ncbi:MAG: AsnC family transcriptional regulator [Acetobacteraceae bacterium]|nr:AsnC family transcriptional regulator [Acetobacteraceae bacterium]
MAKSALVLDAIDRRILQVLQAVGRLPIVALADRVGLSLALRPPTCQA